MACSRRQEQSTWLENCGTVELRNSPKWCLELARVVGTGARLRTLLENFVHGTGPVHEPYAFLDTLELDELQVLRLPPDFFRIFSRPSLKIVKKHCLLANLSESFYRCISKEQWLRTVVEWQTLGTDSKGTVTIHSNVVPSQAYLSRLEGMEDICLGSGCSGGFFPTSVLRESPELESVIPPRHCKDCALAEKLKGRTQRREAESVKFWYVEVGDVELVEELGKGSEGAVSKILWRKGTFVRKRFKPYQSVSFNRELDVALEVSHPNIVHIFGCSPPGSSNSLDSDLFMELLSKDLGRFITEGARLSEDNESQLPFHPFESFEESLDVLLQVAQAVKHLHEKNFVHGDLKPQNILMDCFALTHSSSRYYLIKVADFGNVQRVNSSGATVEPFRSGIGTLRYTAPEVLRCRRHGGAPPEHPQKIDVYSFGVVAYQVLTGVPNLYGGLKSSEITEGVIQGRLRPDFDSKGALDSHRKLLMPLIQRCWAPLPEHRPSFSQICTEIQALVPMITNPKRVLRNRKAAA